MVFHSAAPAVAKFDADVSRSVAANDALGKSNPLAFNCLMQKATKETPYDQTIVQCGVEKSTGIEVASLIACAHAQKGEDLFEANGKKTALIQSPLGSVPTVVFNKSFNKADSDAAVSSFKSALCSRITENPKPKACDNANGGAPSITVSMISVLTAGLIIRQL